MLLDAGADSNAINAKKETVFAIAIRSKNIQLLEVMVPRLSIDADTSLLFHFGGSLVMDAKFSSIVVAILRNKRPKPESINHINDDGFTALLLYFKDFFQNYQVAFTKLLKKIESIIKERGKEPEEYGEFDNAEILKVMREEPASSSLGDGTVVSEEDKSWMEASHRITGQLMEAHVVAPFVQLVQEMVNQGADPGAQIAQVKEKIEKKEDPLVEEARRQYVRDYAWDFDQESTDEDELTEEDKKIRKKRLKMKKKVEINEKSKYNIYGKKNAWHFAADMTATLFSERIFDMLFSLGVDLQAEDLNQNTPIMLQVLQARPKLVKEKRTSFFERAIQTDIDVDAPDADGNTYFQSLVHLGDYENAYKFFEAGADPNTKSKHGRFALKSVFQEKNLDLLKEFCDAIEALGANTKNYVPLNMQQVDDKRRNFLHFAMNDSLASIDASFETLRFLLDKNVDYNAVDSLGRTPLHYAFCKMDPGDESSRDPIEIVSNMLALEDLQLNVADKWGKTPLHYACRYGSNIAAFYMI